VTPTKKLAKKPAKKSAKVPSKSAIAAALAQKINAHLQRIEHDKALNPGKRFDKIMKEWVLDEMGVRAFYGARAAGDRHRVWIIYITYQGGSYVPIEDAETYLAWLDAGNVGRHFEAIRKKELIKAFGGPTS
jgi:hypothetical protein